MTNQKTDDAVSVLKKMAARNRIHNYNVDRRDLLLNSDEKPVGPDVDEGAKDEPKENCCQIWHHPRLLVRFLVFSFGW